MNKQSGVRKKILNSSSCLIYQIRFLIITTSVASIFFVLGMTFIRFKNEYLLNDSNSLLQDKDVTFPLPHVTPPASHIPSIVRPLAQTSPYSPEFALEDNYLSQEKFYKFYPSSLQSSQELQEIVNAVVNLVLSNYFGW